MLSSKIPVNDYEYDAVFFLLIIIIMRPMFNSGRLPADTMMVTTLTLLSSFFKYNKEKYS